MICDDEWLSVSKATLALHLTRERVIRMIQRGEIAGTQIDGRWYVAASVCAADPNEER